MSIRYEDLQQLYTTEVGRRETALKMVDELQQELLDKSTALSDATRELALARRAANLSSPSEGGSGTGSPSAMDQLRRDMQSLRDKIGQHEEEKRRWLAEQRQLVQRAESQVN